MSRKQKHEIQINAAPDDIWRSLTEAEKITSWFAPEAKITPGQGGSLTLSWGPGMEGTGPIHLWEPGKRFGWTEPGEHPKVVEFEIEAVEGGATTLRLIQSGFGEGAKFEDEYEAVNGGWRTYVRALKFSLEHHLNQPCRPVCSFRMVNLKRDEITPRLSAALGLAPSLDDLREGQPYTSNFGIEGVRLEPDKPGYYLLTADNWNQSLIGLFAEQMGEKCYFTLQAFLFGDAASHGDHLQQSFANLLLDTTK